MRMMIARAFWGVAVFAALAGCGGTKVTIPDSGANSDMSQPLGCAGLLVCIKNCGSSMSASFDGCATACTNNATAAAYNLLSDALFYCPAEEFCRSAPDGGMPPCSADDVDPTKNASTSCKACVDGLDATAVENACAIPIHNCTNDGP